MWTNATVIGCRFHLCQAWYRKIQNLGLSNEYNLESNVGKFLKYFFGLQFLKPDDVGDVFAFDLFDVNVHATKDKVVLFCDYTEGRPYICIYMIYMYTFIVLQKL